MSVDEDFMLKRRARAMNMQSKLMRLNAKVVKIIISIFVIKI